jgi:hypothetical protein
VSLWRNLHYSIKILGVNQLFLLRSCNCCTNVMIILVDSLNTHVILHSQDEEHDMTEQEIQKHIRSLEAQLKKARAQLEAITQDEWLAACARGELVVAYEMRTGTKYVCGKTAYMVSHRNAYGEHKITQGKRVVFAHTRNPVAELTLLFGVSAYRAPKIDARKT